MFKKYKNDILVIMIIVVISVIIAIIINIYKTEGTYVTVTIDGEVYEKYDLAKDITIELSTGNTLVIQDHKAYVSESTCRDKICVNHGHISSIGESIICLPHKLVIEIKGGDQ